MGNQSMTGTDLESYAAAEDDVTKDQTKEVDAATKNPKEVDATVIKDSTEAIADTTSKVPAEEKTETVS